MTEPRTVPTQEVQQQEVFFIWFLQLNLDVKRNKILSV